MPSEFMEQLSIRFEKDTSDDAPEIFLLQVAKRDWIGSIHLLIHTCSVALGNSATY